MEEPYFVPTPASLSVSQPRLGNPLPLDPPPATPEPKESGLAEANDSFRAFAARWTTRQVRLRVSAT